ncbi:MAG: 4-(cytidine 5'-diphospho)-2-C-methyl-D-erythritol kinase [Actinobacteria bacterium]|nr:4-(cytidine 5'-diphospho)-2-C-methyl-D-erythritol kinase [Actinomycetota bacterium]
MRGGLSLKAPAKINLYLEVGQLRPDGYHLVRTVMQAVALCDLVKVEVQDGGVGVELLVEGDAPPGEENLCHRAATAFLEAARLEWGVNIRLRKRIPVAAGLGGGSSDAAAVLRGLNHLAGDILPREELMGLAASLGSDVPFFLVGGTALGEGRGERIIPQVQAPPLPVVLVNPGKQLSAADVYRRFDLVGGDRPPRRGPYPLLEYLARGEMGRLPDLLYNSLQRAACELEPSLERLLALAREAGAAGALVSGSGPTVFLLASGEEEASRLEKRMGEAAPWVCTASFCPHGAALAEEEAEGEGRPGC